MTVVTRTRYQSGLHTGFWARHSVCDLYAGGFCGITPWIGPENTGDLMGALGDTDAFTALPWEASSHCSSPVCIMHLDVS